MQIPELQSVMEKWLTSTPLEATAEIADAGSDEAVDPDALGLLLGTNDPEMLAKFYNDFLATSSEVASQIVLAFAEDELKKVGELAHKLKSSARTVGANSLADCCLALEHAGKAGDGAELNLQMSRFQLRLKGVQDWLEQRNRSNPSRG